MAQQSPNAKINREGVYQPFYGYTVVAMVKPYFTAIEAFIKASSLGKYFKALPHDTYHMTIFNIYVMGVQPYIPPIKKWMKENHIPSLSPIDWLPPNAMDKENLDTNSYLDSLNKDLKITKAKLYGSKKSLTIQVEMDDESWDHIRAIRKRIGTIYGCDDPSLDTRGAYHITLAYGFNKHIDDPNIKSDFQKLYVMVKESFTNISLQQPNLYLFSAMDTYLPYKSYCISDYPSTLEPYNEDIAMLGPFYGYDKVTKS